MEELRLAYAQNSKAIRTLTKLLDAAQRAQINGKYLALGKIIKEAKKISDKLSEDKDEDLAYKKVSGIVIEN